jgi:hypothetical protein
VEERVAQPVLVRDLEIAGRDDLVGVDVLARQRDDRTRERGERAAISATAEAGSGVDARQRPGIGDDPGDRGGGGGQRRREE